MKLKKIDTSTSNYVELASLLMKTKFIYVDESIDVGELPYTLVEGDLKPVLVEVSEEVRFDSLRNGSYFWSRTNCYIKRNINSAHIIHGESLPFWFNLDDIVTKITLEYAANEDFVVTPVDGKVLIDDVPALLLDLQKRVELLEGKK